MEHNFANKYHVFLYLVFHFSLLNPANAFYLYRCLTTKTFAANSPYQFNLDTLLASLSSSATASAEFYNTTAGGRNSLDTVYGLFMCRGDVPHQVCRDCVVKGTQQLASVCQLMKEGILWYDDCFVRYSNRSFFSTVDEWPRIGAFNTVNITNKTSFTWTLANTLSQVVAEAANFGLAGTKNLHRKK